MQRIHPGALWPFSVDGSVKPQSQLAEVNMKAVKGTDLLNRYFGDMPGEAEPVKQGEFEITTDEHGQRWFWFCCPGSCKSVAGLAIRPVVPRYADRQSWEWNGNADTPTLTPSINHVGCWHGWLTEGVFTAA